KVATTPSAPNASRMAGVASGFGPSSNVNAATGSSPGNRRWTRPNNGLLRSKAPQASAPTDTTAADAIVPIIGPSRGDTFRAENSRVQTQDHVADPGPPIRQRALASDRSQARPHRVVVEHRRQRIRQSTGIAARYEQRFSLVRDDVAETIQI